MEAVTLSIYNFTNTASAVQSFVDRLCDDYRSALIRDDKKATGNLVSSITPLQVEFGGSTLTGAMSLASYWKYVEYGRKPGKWPPQDKILKWIKDKPVKPSPDKSGRIPTEKQLSFLISRKIGLNGIKPGNQLEESMRLTWSRSRDSISEAVSKDLDTQIAKITVI